MYETDTTLEGHLVADNGIINGGTVILEYVDESVTELGELDKYKL